MIASVGGALTRECRLSVRNRASTQRTVCWRKATRRITPVPKSATPRVFQTRLADGTQTAFTVVCASGPSSVDLWWAPEWRWSCRQSPNHHAIPKPHHGRRIASGEHPVSGRNKNQNELLPWLRRPPTSAGPVDAHKYRCELQQQPPPRNPETPYSPHRRNRGRCGIRNRRHAGVGTRCTRP